MSCRGWEDVGCNGRPGKKQAWNPGGSDSEVEVAGDWGDQKRRRRAKLEAISVAVDRLVVVGWQIRVDHRPAST